MPGAGGHHSDQAERTHRSSAQSGRHRQHYHAGGHSLRNELLHGAVDPPQEIQAHHKYILRRFTRSKPHTKFLIHVRKHVYTYKSICIHIWAKSSTGRVRDVKERKVLPFPAPPKCRTLKNISFFFCLVLSLTLLVFLF